MSFQPVNNSQSNTTPDPRRPILPFRLRPYQNMLALSVGLFLIILVLACVICSILWLLGGITWFLSWSLGIIVASAGVWGISYINENERVFDGNHNAALALIVTWVVIWIVVTCLTYDYLYNTSLYLFELSTDCWDKLMLFFEQSGIAYWSWIPISLMILYGAVSLVLLWIMKLLDWRPHWGLVRFICPHEDCGRVSSSLVYKCPHCGETLENLFPSRYGIFYTPCPNCGTSLNASWLTGRNQYSKTCPECKKSLNYEGFGNLPESVFVVEGASRSGKTSFLIQAMNLWDLRFKSFVHFSDSQQERSVHWMAEQIRLGNFFSPTPRREHPEAYIIHCRKSLHSFLAYFYDTGSVTHKILDAGSSEPYYNLANGIFLVIDPWAENGILRDFGMENNLRYSKYQFATQDADAVIGRLCSKLEHLYSESLSDGFDIPICVVVTKCDINGLNNVIGMVEQFSQSSTKWDEQSQLVEEFLVKHGMYNFVNVVKTRFKKNAFFAVSVLDEGSRYQNSVLNPLLWMTCNVK